jgi:DNA polymerase-3 subunit alpha
MYLIFDTETTGLPKRWKAPVTDTDNWPRCVQIAWQLHDDPGVCLEHCDFLVRPDGFNIPYDAEKIHGISTALAESRGVSLNIVLEKFNEALSKAKFVVGQNVGFDLNIMGCEFHRMQVVTTLNTLPVLDTCTEVTASLCQLPGGRGGKFKLPTLTELHQYLFKTPFAEAHNATADVEATTRCFLELLRRGSYSAEQLQADTDYLQKFQAQNSEIIAPLGLKHVNLKKSSTALAADSKNSYIDTDENKTKIKDVPPALLDAPVVHLHNHSQFSILQSTISIKKISKCYS